MPRLNSCTCRRDKRKCSRSALSRLPNSRLDDEADMALPILTEFGYVTANGPFIHKVNDLLRKPEQPEIVANRPCPGLRPLSCHHSSTTEGRLYRLMLGDCPSLVAVPDKRQIVVAIAFRHAYRD